MEINEHLDRFMKSWREAGNDDNEREDLLCSFHEMDLAVLEALLDRIVRLEDECRS